MRTNKEKIIEFDCPECGERIQYGLSQTALDRMKQSKLFYSSGEEVYVKFTPDARKGSDTGLYLFKDHPNYSEPLFSAHLKKLTLPVVTEEEIYDIIVANFTTKPNLAKALEAANCIAELLNKKR